MRGIKATAILAALMLLTTACSSVKLDDQAPIEERAAKPVEQPAPKPAPEPVPASGAVVGGENASDAANRARSTDPLDDPDSVLAKRSVYFDLDSFSIKDEFRPMIEAHGKYLASHPERKVVIQGHTDERGGSEYNLALGQKRAEAVRRALSLAGAKDSQLEAVSFGKEKPKATGSNEEAWAQNRRADIVY